MTEAERAIRDWEMAADLCGLKGQDRRAMRYFFVLYLNSLPDTAPFIPALMFLKSEQGRFFLMLVERFGRREGGSLELL